MANELITSWRDYERHAQHVMAQATRELRIFDEDLSALRFESRETIALIERFVRQDGLNRVWIVVRNANHARNACPLLMRVLSFHAHQVVLIERPPELATLSDSLILADDRHALVRFHQDNARSRAYIDEPEQCLPYLNRFNEILAEGGDVVSPFITGL